MTAAYVAPFSKHIPNGSFALPGSLADRFNWDAPIETWAWMNGAAFAQCLAMPASKSSVTAIGIWYRSQPKAVCKRIASARLMLIPPLRAALTPV